MSFILDALKKSEAERARQAGPALLEMRIVRPRRRVAPWILVLALLLAVNLALLLWFMLRHESAPPAGAAAAGAPPAGMPAAAPPAPAATGRATAPPSVVAPATPADTLASVDRGVLPPAAAFVADPGARVAGEDAHAYAATDNPADLEPAVSPGSGSVRTAPAGRPGYSELGGEVPELRLDLHVYASQPQQRYALINMHKVREGEVLPEGPRVVEITRDGVVLAWQGREFVLGRE
ncbi:MAG: general secretion pathway protein GspB [Gammaproteobacteria bacterium]|nr:general secretion pathway protein GspB [Gammaproteobacteria bacterium]